jgi:hypothetical protein
MNVCNVKKFCHTFSRPFYSVWRREESTVGSKGVGE